MTVGDVGHLAGIGEAKATRCRHDDAVEDVQLEDLQHMLDGAELLATRGPSRPAHPPTRARLGGSTPGSATSTTTAVAVAWDMSASPSLGARSRGVGCGSMRRHNSGLGRGLKVGGVGPTRSGRAGERGRQPHQSPRWALRKQRASLHLDQEQTALTGGQRPSRPAAAAVILACWQEPEGSLPGVQWALASEPSQGPRSATGWRPHRAGLPGARAGPRSTGSS
jgi:hypothetical protein